jgi:environmental stress-induced protein Ves
VQILRRDAFTPSVWKNGGGRTHEVFRVPAAGDPFRWRLSLAEVERSGPFSDFSGYQRLLTLLDGAFALRFSNGESHRLAGVGDLLRFDGALGVECELASRASTDLNLIVSNAIAGVRARVVSLTAPLAVHLVPGATLAIFAVAGALTVTREVSAGASGASGATGATGAPGAAGMESPAIAELAAWDAAIDVGPTARVVRLATTPGSMPATDLAPAQVFFAEFRDTGMPALGQ